MFNPFGDKQQKQDTGNQGDENKIQIFTMRSDLEKLKNPAAARDDNFVNFQKPPENLPTSVPPTQNEGNPEELKNPFMESAPPKTKNEPASEGKEKLIFTDLPSRPTEEQKQLIETGPVSKRLGRLKGLFGPDKASSPVEKEPSESLKQPSPLSKMIIPALIILIVLVAAAGAYYFWMTRVNQSETVVEPAVEQPIQATQPEPEEVELNSSATNFVSVSFGASSQDLISAILNAKEKVKETGELSPFKFQVIDENKEPIGFAKFSQLLNITLPQPITSQLLEDFYLYIKAEGDTAAFGFTTKFNNQAETLKNSLSNEEVNLLGHLKTFLSLSATPPESISDKFETNNYNGVQIRYVNLPTPEKLTIDYAVSGSDLIIATNKSLMLDLVDKL